jgi:DNA repair protein RecO (recombination protein O)
VSGATFHDRVVVTGVIPYGDSDLVVRLFSKEHGRIGSFARKARASKKRFPALSAPSLGTAALSLRHGSDLFDLHELDVEPAILGLAADLRALAHASYVCELVERMFPEHEPAADSFAVVDAAVGRIARHGASAVLLRALELKLLLHVGYLPDLSDPDFLELPDDARAVAHALVITELDALPDVDTVMLRTVARVFGAHLRRQGGPPLKSVAFLDAVARAEGPIGRG